MTEYLQRETNKITVANFYEGHQLKKYNFDPPYQRRSLWTDEKKSFLIDSVMRNFPIPPIFLHQKIDNASGKTSYDVIDGKQRLTALVAFINNELPVTDESDEDGNENPLAGKYFNELVGPELGHFKALFWRYVIPIEYVDTGDSKVIDSIFDRLNRNGEPLTGQELRHSTYYGTALLELIEELSRIAFWKTRLEVVDKARMEEEEFISELVFLILEKMELRATQELLDASYKQYHLGHDKIFPEVRTTFLEATKFLEALELDFAELRIGGVSHLYGLFAFSYRCVTNSVKAADVKAAIGDFYDHWSNKNYSIEKVKEYKESMSSRTKERGQRKKRTEALLSFCGLDF